MYRCNVHVLSFKLPSCGLVPTCSEIVCNCLILFGDAGAPIRSSVRGVPVSGEHTLLLAIHLGLRHLVGRGCQPPTDKKNMTKNNSELGGGGVGNTSPAIVRSDCVTSENKDVTSTDQQQASVTVLLLQLCIVPGLFHPSHAKHHQEEDDCGAQQDAKTSAVRTARAKIGMRLPCGVGRCFLENA